MKGSKIASGFLGENEDDFFKGINENFGSFMDSMLAGINVNKGEEKGDDDPLDGDDEKATHDFSLILRLAGSSKLAKVIGVWKLKAENILRKKGNAEEEVEATAELLGGVGGSTVYWYRKAGRMAHLLFLAGFKFSALPRSIDALATLGQLTDEDAVKCYEQCRLDYGSLTIDAAESAVATFMKNNSDRYEYEEQKPKSKRKPEPDEKSMTQKIETVMAEIKSYIARNAKNKAARAEMRTQRAQLKSILKMYESVLAVKTHRSNGNDGE